MKKRPLGQSGIEASVVSFGAWAIGGWKWGGTDADDSIASIRAALDVGVNFIDTAAVYGFGLSELLVGKAIAGRPRDEIIIASKCGLRWDIESEILHYEGDGKRVYRTLAARSIVQELEASLERLGTDYIDLYQTHWPDKMTPLAEVVATLEQCKASGKIRAWGFCNSDSASLEDACELGQIASDQERYSFLDREQDEQNLPICAERGLSFLCYSPIAQGLLTGRMDAKREFKEGDLRIGNPRFAPEVLNAVQAVLAPIKALSRDRGVTTEQLVLAWTLKQKGVSHVLVGTRDADQAKANAIAGSLELDDDELDIITQAAHAWPGFASFA